MYFIMREFIYYPKSAVTAGNLIKDNLMQAGRMDIVCNVIIAAFFTSNNCREDVKFHMIFDGPPHAPRHLILESNEDLSISKKNVAGLIRKMLYKSPTTEGLSRNKRLDGATVRTQNRIVVHRSAFQATI